MNDIICPECKATVSMTNVIGFEKDEVELIGITYLLECKKCSNV